MNFTAVVAAVIIAGASQAREPKACGPHQLTIYLSGEEAFPQHIVVAAEMMAARMLSEAAVKVSWRTQDSHSGTRPGHHMFVAFIDDAKGFQKGALATAKSDEGL